MRKLVGTTVVILFLSMILGGCTTSSDKDREKFVGTWKTNYSPNIYNSTYVVNHTYTFYPNGSASGYFATAWALRDGKLVITYSTNAVTYTSMYTYVFSNQNRALTITDVKYGNPINYSKLS